MEPSSSSAASAPTPLVMNANPQAAPSCSPCAWCGQKMSWHQAIPTCGCITSGGAAGAALGGAVCFSAVAGPLSIAAAALSAVSCLLHGGSSLSICCVAPLGELEDTVDTAERTVGGIALDIQEISSQILQTGQLTEQQAKLLEREFNQLEEQRKFLENENQKLRLRNENLNESMRRLEEGVKNSQPVIESFSNALVQFKTIVTDFQPKKVAETLESFTAKIGQLKLLGSRAEDTKKRTDAYSQAYVNAEKNFQEAMDIITQKLATLGQDNEDLRMQNDHLKVQIDKLTEEIQKSSSLHAKLEKNTQMLKDVTEAAKNQQQTIEQNEKTIAQLKEANIKFEKLFNRPDVQELIKKER